MYFEEEEAPQFPANVIICRHGETDWNLMKKFQGRIDIPLNDAGITQAEQLARTLKSRNLAAVVVSPLTRARQTGQAIANLAGVRIHEDDRLRERELGIMQGLTAKDVRAKHPDLWRAWKTQQAFPAAAGVEPGPEVVARMESALFDLARQYAGRTVAVVCHGAAIRCVTRRAVGTAGITQLTVGPGRSWTVSLPDWPTHLGGQRPAGLSDQGGDLPPSTVMLCRHGETDWSLAGRFQGTVDIPLNAAGRRQAQHIAAALAPLGPRMIWCSPMRRSKTTGHVLAQSCGVTLHTDSRLRERHLGVMQGRSPAELEEDYPAVIAAWKAEAPLPEEAHAEPEQEVVERVEAALYDLAAAHPGRSTAVILHEATIRCLLQRAVAPARITTPRSVNVTTLIVRPVRRWEIVHAGDASQLPRVKPDTLNCAPEETGPARQPVSPSQPDASSAQLSKAEIARPPALQSRL